MELDGNLAGRAQLYGDAAALADVKLAVDLDVGCRVRVDPPLADAHALAGTIDRPHATDAHGAPRAFSLGPQNPSWRALDAFGPALQRAVLEAEDDRFFQHHGFDLDHIRRAVAADLSSRKFSRGASTLTQQLVKNLFLSGERTAARKLEEAVLTWRTEQVLSKRRILELYLNLVELGPGIYGFAEASERYFGKEPDQLSLDEAAQLAALLPAPRRGMDAAWHKRYENLRARLPNEIVLGMR
jgi:membrane carboxypeptidase/penicillin-binding protein